MVEQLAVREESCQARKSTHYNTGRARIYMSSGEGNMQEIGLGSFNTVVRDITDLYRNADQLDAEGGAEHICSG